MHCIKLPGPRLAARDVDRQVAEVRNRVTILNGFTALSIPATHATGQVPLRKGKLRPSDDLCSRVFYS